MTPDHGSFNVDGFEVFWVITGGLLTLWLGIEYTTRVNVAVPTATLKDLVSFYALLTHAGISLVRMFVKRF